MDKNKFLLLAICCAFLLSSCQIDIVTPTPSVVANTSTPTPPRLGDLFPSPSPVPAVTETATPQITSDDRRMEVEP